MSIPLALPTLPSPCFQSRFIPYKTKIISKIFPVRVLELAWPSPHFRKTAAHGTKSSTIIRLVALALPPYCAPKSHPRGWVLALVSEDLINHIECVNWKLKTFFVT